MPATAYSVVAAPRYASMRSWDCSRCGRAEVKPVFLSDGATVAPYGTGCAARLLGWTRDGARRARSAFDAAEYAARQHDELLAERRTSYAVALEAFHSDGSAQSPHLDRARRTYGQMGGFGVLGSFPAWIAHVADTGELDAAPEVAA